MAIIFESPNFIVKSVDRPHVDREDGGHIMIMPKVKVVDRQHLNPKNSIEVMRLLAVTGEATTTVMNAHGVDIGRINYQDMGNWAVFLPEGPSFHYHLYGRAKSAKFQKYGETIYTPLRETHPDFYADFKPLTSQDISEIKKEIERLLVTEKYSGSEWGIE